MSIYIRNTNTAKFICTELNQSRSNELNENDIVELSKIAQLGQFNDISNGNTSTILYGGVIFPEDFDYDDEDSTTCTSPRCTNMSYTLRFTYKYVQYETDSLYSQGAGPSDSGNFISRLPRNNIYYINVLLFVYEYILFFNFVTNYSNNFRKKISTFCEVTKSN